MLILAVVNGARSEGEPSSLAMTFIEHRDETQTVPDVQSGGVHVGSDLVTWLQLCGADTMYALRPLRRGIKHYTFGSASDQDIVLPGPYVSARHGRLVRTPLGLRVVDLQSRNGTYFEGRRKKSFYLEPGQTFVVGACSHRVLALNDEMHAHYPALTAILGYDDEHVAQRETPSPSELIVSAVAGPHMLIVSEPHCDQVRLARIVHAISLLRVRPLVAFDHVPGNEAMQSDPALDQAATVLLNLEDNRAPLDPTFTSRLFSPRNLTRVIVLARSVRVANAVLGEHYVQQMKEVRLAPPSGRPGAIHRLLDMMFQERGTSLRVSAMTPYNQAALRSHRWAHNFASLREAADRLVVVARQGSLRKTALALGIPPATFHNWYANILGLTQPLFASDVHGNMPSDA
jgi:hypothetical protein